MKIHYFLVILLSSFAFGQINTGSGGGGGTLTGVAGTANQITSDGASPVTTLSTPSTFIAPGTIAATTTVSGTQLISTVATGTAPLTVASTTAVTNLNSSQLLGNTWAVPSTIGSTTRNTGAFSSLACGVTGATSCVLTGSGSTSGTATLTWPATAGTSTNPITFSNVIAGAAGTAAAPTLSVTAGGYGVYLVSGQGVGIGSAGNDSFLVNAQGINVISSAGVQFWSGTVFSGGSTPDSILSRSAAGVITFNTTAVNNGLGTARAAKFQTSTNCAASGTAANPSVVTCTAAAAGIVYCDVAASAGTCTVNTTAVTTNSEIIISLSGATSDGTLLSKTCNTAPSVVPGILLNAKATGTSFTLNVPTGVTNGFCFHYYIVN